MLALAAIAGTACGDDDTAPPVGSGETQRFDVEIANVGRRVARTRLALVLCEFAVGRRLAGLGAETSYELPMTQDQLADATGLTPVHVNRVLQTLERDGLIERTTPKSVIIGDWKRLAAAGDFRPDYLHLDMARRRAEGP